MPEGAMRLEYVSVELCRNSPNTYKLCTSAICVHIDTPCPCQHGMEFRCSDGQCIPSSAQCNGTRDCSRGEDEISCPGQVVTSPGDGLPLHVIIAITSVCLIVCLASIIVVGYFVFRRRKNNTSRESQSVTQPLKTKYPSPIVDSSDKYDEPAKSSKRDYVYHQMYDASGDFEYEYEKKPSDGTGERREKKAEQHKKSTFMTNICTVRNKKIYDFEHDANDSFGNCEMGKYIFKPRLKGAHAQKGVADSRTSGVHEIVHSYKHAHDGQRSVPTTFNLDLDPENFCSTELLCASTPRQPPRRLVVHQSHDSLADDVISVNKMADKDLRGGDTKESLCKADSENTNKINTDRSLLSISTNVEYIDVGPSVTDTREDLKDELF